MRVHRVATLDEGGRLVLFGLLFVVGVLPFVSAAVVLRNGWKPMGDNALIGLRVHDVLRGRFPLTGQPSTGANFGSGIASNHPGPIEFYLLAPFVGAFGPTWGLALGAAVINAGSMVTSVWVAFRRGGLALCALAAVSLMAMAHSVGGNVLHDPVSSQVGAMAAILVMLTAWSVAAGDLRLIPLFLFAASFVLQDHLSYLVTLGPVTAVGATGGAWWLWQTRGTGSATSRGRRRRTAGIIALGFLVVWSPVLWDELFGSANLQAVFRTFTGKRTATEGFSFAIHRLLDAIGLPPIFARAVPGIDYLRPPSLVASAGAALVLGGIVVLADAAWRRRRTDLVALAGVALAAVVGGLFGAVKLPVGAGVQTTNLRWMWFVSVIVWFTLAWLLWERVSRVPRARMRPTLMAVGGVLVVVTWLSTVLSVRASTDRDGLLFRPANTLSAAVRDALPAGSYRVLLRGGTALLSVGPAVVYDLDNGPYRPYLDLGIFTSAYTRERTFRSQDVLGTLVITSETVPAPRGSKFVGSVRYRDDFVFASQPPGTVRAYLLPETKTD